MIKGRIECWNVKREKVVKCLAKFGASFPAEFKGWSYKKKFFIIFKLDSVRDFKELMRRLKRIKGIRLKCSLD